MPDPAFPAVEILPDRHASRIDAQHPPIDARALADCLAEDPWPEDRIGEPISPEELDEVASSYRNVAGFRNEAH